MILVDFFLNKVIPREAGSKMGLKNICIVLAPCIMRAEVITVKDIIYSQKAIMVTSIIFREFANIFGNKKQRQATIRISAKNSHLNYLEDRLGDVELKPVSLTTSQNEVIMESKKEEEEEFLPDLMGPEEGDGEDTVVEKRARKITLCKQISTILAESLEDEY